MEHVYGIVGGALGLLGGLVLAADLWMSKTQEESAAEFKLLQDQIDLGAQQVAIGLASNMSVLSEFLVKYFQLLELDLPQTRESQARKLLTDALVNRLDRYIKRDQVSEVIELAKTARSELEQRFMAEVARSQRMRWIALAGVILVAVGAIGQIADLLLGP